MSATGDQVKALVRSHGSGDDDSFYAIAGQIVAAAATKGHRRLANDLALVIDNARNRPAKRTLKSLSNRDRRSSGQRADSEPFFEITPVNVSLADLVASADLICSLERVIAEQQQRERLNEEGFAPIHRLLLEGPPGTGKTMTAAVLAHELDLPLMTIRLDSLISSYMGTTAGNLAAIFDEVGSERAVYLFDEFDALAASRSGDRGTGTDVGEARRIVNSLLLFIENVEPESVVIAATNHLSILDRAVFRRFDLMLTYLLPTIDEAIAVLKQRLGKRGETIQWDTIEWSLSKSQVGTLSQAEFVVAAESAAKQALLDGEDAVTSAGLLAALKEWRFIDVGDQRFVGLGCHTL